jgi:type VI protein secretion system component VasK
MSNYFFNLVWSVLFFAFITFCQPALALAEGGESEPGWVLAYALILILLFGAVTVIVVRTAGRRESAFSESELAAKREEEIKKITKH